MVRDRLLVMLRIRCWPLAVVLLLASCGGGGGGGGPGLPTGGGSPASFETEEYRRSGGLGLIDAASAYARGASGRGVGIAVIDTGIDPDHPDLDGQISPASTDILTGRSAFLNDLDGHGTAVAGVAAAERNGLFGHGVAWGGQILAIRADSVGSCNTICGFAESDVAAATNYAVSRGAAVINYSLGGAGSLGPTLRSALTQAADRGTVLVFAAGNGGAASPGFPARAVVDPGLDRHGIAVGAVDRSGQIAVFSDRAGVAAERYLAAPGVSILASAPGGGAVSVTGTSFAAPHVAGAAAVVMEAAPHLGGAEVASLLLETASDLGAPGTDAVYGRGLLDLAEALRPQGSLAIPLGHSTDGPAAPLEATSLAFGQAFGPATDLPAAVFLDAYGRPYWTGLDQQVTASRKRLTLERWLTAEPGRQVSLPVSRAARLDLVLDRAAASDPLVQDSDPEAEAPVALTLTAEATSISFGREGVGLGDWFGLQALVPEAGSDLISGELLASPHLRLLDEADSFAFRQGLSAGWSLGIGVARGAAGDVAPSGDRLAAVEALYRRPGAGGVGLQFGRLEEARGPLQTRGAGAFGLGDAQTSFVGASGYLPLPSGPILFGQISYGRTEVADAPGLLQDFSTLHSVGAAVGARFQDLMRGGDRLAISVAQPLRLMDGNAVLDRPVARTVDGTVLRERRPFDLTPAGREIDLELAYRVPLQGGLVLGANWLTQLEPGHDADAAPVHAAMVKVSRRL